MSFPDRMNPESLGMVVTEKGMRREYEVFHRAPVYNAVGGEVFFDDDVTKRGFTSVLSVLGVKACHGNVKPYTDFRTVIATSMNVSKDRYLHQLRVVSSFAERFLFNSIDDEAYENYPQQPLNLVDTLWKFIADQKKLYSWNYFDGKTAEACERLAGLYNGDGDDAYESLSFGFMVESDHYGVYRIWSKPWLVTK